jgi:hypothetical protein
MRARICAHATSSDHWTARGIINQLVSGTSLTNRTFRHDGLVERTAAGPAPPRDLRGSCGGSIRGHRAGKGAQRLDLLWMDPVRRRSRDAQIDCRARLSEDLGRRAYAIYGHPIVLLSTGQQYRQAGERAWCRPRQLIGVRADQPAAQRHEAPQAGPGRDRVAGEACALGETAEYDLPTPRASSSSSVACTVASAPLRCGSLSLRGAMKRPGYQEPPGAAGATQAIPVSSRRSAASAWMQGCARDRAAARASRPRPRERRSFRLRRHGAGVVRLRVAHELLAAVLDPRRQHELLAERAGVWVAVRRLPPPTDSAG